jgi:integrase
MRGHLRKRGSAWELRAYAGLDPISGKQKYVTRTFRGGKREAEEALARLVSEVSGGAQSAQDATVADVIREWLAVSGSSLSPTTLRGYDWIVRTYIVPHLGPIRLARLGPAQLDRYYAKLMESGGREGAQLSPATVRQVHAILRRALEQAVRWGWIPTNPASRATPPKPRPPELAPPDPAAVIALIKDATEHDPDFGCFLHLAATTGARRSEVCALRWRDLDLKSGSLVIGRGIVEGAEGRLIEKDTKTHASRRIALDRETVKVLRAHRDRMKARASELGLTFGEESLVFSREPDGSRPWTPNDVTKQFIRCRKRVGQPNVRLHDLRHFAASRLLAAGVSVRTVSGRLGHANAATTLGVYAHFIEESDRDAAAKLGALVAPRPGRRTKRAS